MEETVKAPIQDKTLVPTENLKKLHDNLSKREGFNIPLEQFEKDMQDESNLKRLHDNLAKQQDFTVPYDQFKTDMFAGQPSQPETEQPLTYMQKELRQKFPENYTEEIPQPEQQPVKPLGKVDQLKVDYLRKTRGDEFANQEQAKMQAPEQEKPSFAGKLAGTVGNSFMTGLNNLNSWAADAPGFIYDLAGSPFRAVGLSVPTSQDFKDTPLQNISSFYKDNAKAYEQKVQQANPSRGNGVIASFENGDIEGGILNLAGGIAESAPASIAMMLSGGATAPTIIGGAAVFGAGKAQEMDENAPEMDYDKRRVISALNGTIEGIFETYLGSGAVGKSLAGIIKNQGKEAAQEQAKRSLSTVFADMITKNPWMAPLGEGFEEVGTQISQNLVDKYSGYRPELDLMEGVGDSFLSGVGMGGIHGAVIGLAKSAMDTRNATPITTATIEGQQYTINNPEDLGIEGKPIFAKDAEGNVKAVANHKATDPITQTQGEIDQAQQAAADQQALMNGIADPNAQILNDENFDEENTRIVDFSNGQSKIIYNGQEVIANDVNEKDVILNSINDFQKLPEPKVNEVGEVIQPAPERKVITQKIGSTDIDIIEGEEFDEVVPSEKVPLEKAYAALEKKFKDNKKFKVVTEKVQVEEPGETKYDEPVKRTVIKSIKIVPVEVLEKQKQADTDILLNIIDEFNATPQSREDAQKASEINSIAKKLGYQTERNASNQIRLFDNSGTIEKPKTQSNDNTNSNSGNNVQVSNEGTSSMGRSGLGSDVEGEKQNLVKLNVNNSGQESENVSNNLEATIENQIVENVNAENSLQKEKLQNEDSEKVIQPTAGIVAKEGEDTPQAQQGEGNEEGLEENVETRIYRIKKRLKNINLGISNYTQHGLVSSINETTAQVGQESIVGVGNHTVFDLTLEEQKEQNSQFKAHNKDLTTAKEFNDWRRDFSNRVLNRVKNESIAELAALENTPIPIVKAELNNADKENAEKIKSLANQVSRLPFNSRVDNLPKAMYDLYNTVYGTNFSTYNEIANDYMGHFGTLDMNNPKNFVEEIQSSGAYKQLTNPKKVNTPKNIISTGQPATVSKTADPVADQIAQQEVNLNPTEAQKEAGNYKKAHVTIQGMDIAIENPKGSFRKGVDEDGKAWKTEMKYHYGYFNGTVGKDNDHIDTFIGSNPESNWIFVVDQNNPKTGKFDESKVMTGFNTIDEAKAAYMANYEPDWKGFGNITAVPVEQFKTWLNDGAKQHKPFSEYKGHDDLLKETPARDIDVTSKKPTNKPTSITGKTKEVEVYPSDIQGLALQYFVNGGMVKSDEIARMFRDGSEERSNRFSYTSNKEGLTVNQIAHNIWESLPETIQDGMGEMDVYNAVESVIMSHNSPVSMAKALLAKYSVDPNQGFSEEWLNEQIRIEDEERQSELAIWADDLDKLEKIGQLPTENQLIELFLPENTENGNQEINQGRSIESDRPANPEGNDQIGQNLQGSKRGVPGENESEKGSEVENKEPWQMTSSEFDSKRPFVEGYLYHGSPEGDIKQIDPYAHTKNWGEGLGFYTTVDRNIAGTYAKGRTANKERKTGNGKVNYVKPKDVKTLDMDSPVDNTVWDQIKKSLDVDFYEDPNTNGEAYRELILAYNEDNGTSEGQYTIEEALTDLGYDATIHTEGKKSANPHRVTIWKNEYNLPEIVSPKDVHKEIIQKALSEGKPVPQEVLNDYPELKKQKPLSEFLADSKKEVQEKKQSTPLPEEKQNEDDIRFRAVPNNGNLVALHNISEENIQSAKDRRGKLITPSLAIVQKGVSFTDFGTITLIGTKDMIDPQSGTKVFKGDVYSPTVPRAQYEVDKRTYDRWSSSIMNRAYSPAFREIASKIANVVEDFGSFRKEIARSSAESVKQNSYNDMRMVYVLEKGIDFKIPMKPRPFYIANNYEIKLTPEELKKAKEFKDRFRNETEASSLNLTKETEQMGYDLVREAIQRDLNEKYANVEDPILRSARTEGVAEQIADRVNLNYLTDKIGDLLYGKTELDSDKYNELKDKLFSKKAIKDDYSQWLDEKINQFQGRKYFEKGNEKLTYSTENLVEATIGHTRAKEKGITYGMNKAKASAIKQLKNIEEIRKAQKDLVTKEEMTRIEKELQEEYFDISNKIKYKWRDSFGKYDDFGKSLADYFKGYGANQALHRNDFVPSSYDVDDFKEFADRLKSSPIDYLEAKTQRAVDLSEFKYAVVPESTSKETIKTLKDAGIKVRKYGEYEQRTEVIKEIADKDNAIRFQIIGEKGAANITILVDNLTVAKQMTEAGKDTKTIFLATGWEKFPDGWKYDQKTDQLPLKKDALKELSDNQRLANGLHVFSTMDYRKNADGSYDFSMMKKGATSTSEFVQYRNIPDRDLEYLFDNNTKLINKIRNGEGSEGLIGDMEEAKEIKMDFEHYVSGGMPLNQLVDNNQLFKAYPELAKVVVVYDPNSKAIGSFGRDLDGQSIITTKYVSGPVAKSTIYHEIQHAIQDIEGFAKGGNFEIGANALILQKQKTLDKINAQIIASSEKIRNGNLTIEERSPMLETHKLLVDARNSIDKQIEDIKNNEAPKYNAYQRLSGEVEARNVQARLGMNPQDRYDQLISETQDVAEDQKIYIQDAIGKAYSIENNDQESAESKNLNVSDTASTDLKSRPNVVNALTKISDELGEPVYIINYSEIPDKVSELKKQIKDGNRVPAFFYNSKIYLLSDQVTSVSDALKSYLHELIVHKGLREVFAGADKASIIGKQYGKFNDLMVDVFGSMSRSQKIAIASYYVPNLYNQNGKIMRNPTPAEKALIGEEFLAHVSENQEIYDETTLSRWQQFINRLWQIVRKAFRLTSNQFSQKDLTDIVRESRERLKNKVKGTTEAETRLRVTDEKKSDVSLGEKPMTEKEFYKKYEYQHKDIRSKTKGNFDETLKQIQETGFKSGAYVLPVYKGGKPENIIQSNYGNRKGDFVYLVPKEWVKIHKTNPTTIKEGWKPSNEDVIEIEYDNQSSYEAYLNKQSQPSNTILINGVSRSTLNSNGKPDSKLVHQDLLSRIGKNKFTDYLNENDLSQEEIQDALTGNDEYWIDQYLGDEYQVSVNSDGYIQFEELTPQVKKLIGNNKVLLYHHTSDAIINSIAKDGIISTGANVNRNNYRNLGVYLTTEYSGNAVEGYKNRAWNFHGGNPITLEISTTVDQLKPDDNDSDLKSGRSQFVVDKVKPEDIINLSEFKPKNTITINGVEKSTLNSNGKPIANSEEGIRNFWKWFGDSKVVDSEGRPLVVYHGTTKYGFSEFKGVFKMFSSSKDVADTYQDKYVGEDKGTYETYLKIENSEEVDANNSDFASVVVTEDTMSSKETRLSVRAIAESVWGFRYPGIVTTKSGTGKTDGVIVKNVKDDLMGSSRGKVSDVFIVTDPSQIKSATGNNGSFSPESNDIRFRVEQAVEDLNKINSLPKSNLSDLLKSVNETVEASMAEAHGIKATPLWERIKAKLIEIKESTQHFQHITEAEFPVVYDKLRQFEAIPDRVKKEAYERISEVIRPIAKNQQHFEAFERYIVLQDLVNDIENTELFANKDLPWGYNTVDEIKTDMRNVRTYVMRNPAVLKAVRDRQAMMKEVKQALVDNKLLKDNGNDKYFHHQVLAYMEGQVFPGVSSKDVRNHKKGWQRSRQGSIAAYNTNYLESEFEVLAQSLEQVAIKNILGELGAKTNIMPDLIKQAKQMGGSWRDYIPEGYKQWFPKQGTNAYKAASMAEKAVQNILNDPNSPDVAQFIAEVEGNMWVIPEPVAKQLNSMKDPEKEMIYPAALRQMTGKWKQWTLLNPFRMIKYNFNNMSGDLDIVLAADPRILKKKYAHTAMKEAWNEMRGRGMSPDMQEALQYGIISSGLSVQEIPDINNESLFKSVTRGSGNWAKRAWNYTGGVYWEKATSFTQFRENILRLAAYKFYKEQIESGKTPVGASKHKSIEALYKAGTDHKEIAAKLARELLGDYGNLSQGGQWLRAHSYPFWSWVEINSPRYYQLLKNTKYEDNTGILGKVAMVGAKKITVNVGKLAIGAMILTGLVVLWNRTFWPDEDDELQKLGDNKLKLIVGRRDDGSIITVKVQGAFSDVLSFFSLEDAASDVSELSKGKTTIKKKAIESGSAFVNKFTQGAMPFTKTGFEVITGKALYPDILNPRPIRDRGEQVARMASVDKIYNYLTHKPARPFGKEVSGLLVYDNSPGEAAYYTMRQNIFDFMKDNGEEFPSGEPTERSNALYYYKQSLKFGDTEKASFWFDKYKELGGNLKGYNASMKKGMIINTVPNDLKAAWYQSLDAEDKEVLDMANKWYFETYLKVGIPKKGAK